MAAVAPAEPALVAPTDKDAAAAPADESAMDASQEDHDGEGEHPLSDEERDDDAQNEGDVDVDGEGDGDGEGNEDDECVLESQYDSEIEEPPVVENETEAEAEKRIKQARESKVMYGRACRMKEGTEKSKLVFRAAKLGHLPAEVRRTI